MKFKLVTTETFWTVLCDFYRNMNIDTLLIRKQEYCYENNLLRSECYPMDAIEHNPQLKDALVLLANDSLIRYGLQTEEEIKNIKRETLFSRE